VEALVAFLQQHGLTGAAFAVVWFLLRYYIGNDIKTTKQGITENADAYRKLKEYVEECEDALDKRFLQVESDFKVSKLEQANGLNLIQTSLQGIADVLKTHIDREQVYQDKVDKFMGYAYRKLGNGYPEE
jgi:hypothetical protein